MHATEVGNTVIFNPAPEVQFLAGASMALAVIAGIMLPRIRDGVVAGVAVQALVAAISIALRKDGFQALTVDFGHLLSWINVAVFYVQWLFVFLLAFGCRSLIHAIRAANDDDVRGGNASWLKRLLRLEGEYLLHERALSFPLRPEMRRLSPNEFARTVSALSARLPFVLPMTLTIDNVVLRLPAKGSAGWLLFHRWRFVATIGSAVEPTVDGFLRLNRLDRFMGLFLANAWAVMLAFMIVVVGALLIEGNWSALVVLLMAPLLFLWLRLCFSMYVPQRVRGEASVRQLLGDLRDDGDGPHSLS